MNIKIRPLQEDDARTSVKWRNIPEIWLYTAYTPSRQITLDDELKWIRQVIADPTCRRFAILVNDVYVGNVYLTNIQGDEAEFSIFIGDTSYWGQGIGQQASKLIIDYAKKDLKLTSIILRVSGGNQAALNIYESLQFKKYFADEKFEWMRLNLKDWKS